MNKSHPNHPVYGDSGSSPRNRKQVNKRSKQIKQYDKSERVSSVPNTAEGHMVPPTESGGSITVPNP